MKLAVLFPGQGSQYLGMGKEFIESVPSCAELMKLAESVCNFPLAHVCQEGPMEELTRAAVLQPAITAINLVCLRALLERLDEGAKPEGFAGHSLGEYSALCGAGVLSVEDTLKLVERRGFFMEREGVGHPGGMRAVLGLDIEAVEEAVAAYRGAGVVTVANYNTPQQIVVAGTMEALDEVAERVHRQGGKVIPLNVSVANHSPLVAEAVPDFAAFMDQVTFSRPSVPVYFNVSAAPQENPARIKDMMAQQIASRVRWYELIVHMLEDGFDTFIEVGPKTVLKGLMRKIVSKDSDVTVLQFDTPASLQSCMETLTGNRANN